MRNCRRAKATYWLVALILCAHAANAAVVDRGPWLQQGAHTSIIVKWRTDMATDSVVRYGQTAADLDQSVSSPGVTVDHEVTLAGLSAATRYFYSVGDSSGALAGDSSYFFVTAPAPIDQTATRIWVIGDSGTANANARRVRDAYKNYTGIRGTELWLMLGDNAYINGTDAEYQVAVFDTYPELLRQIPVWPTLGNHDGVSADSASQTGPYYDIFSLPTGAELGGLPSGTEAYYSFEYGNIHFVVLDSHETDRSVDGAMLTWLENDLAFQLKDWLIAFWHHPPYTKGTHDSDIEGELIDMRQNVLPILEAHGVDLVLSGHSHSYERSFLLDSHYGDSDSLDASMLIDAGDGRVGGDGRYAKDAGIGLANQGAVYAVAGSSGTIGGGLLDHEAMFISLNELGSMVLDVDGPRLDAVFLNDTGNVTDSFSIDKGDGIDSSPPLLLQADAVLADNVELRFNEGLQPASAETVGNYAISPGIEVTAASLSLDGRIVSLATTALTPGLVYTVAVTNLADIAGNLIAAGASLPFVYTVSVTRSFQDGVAPNAGYAGTRDTYLSSNLPTGNFGGETSLLLDGDDPPVSGDDLVTLLRWEIVDIPSAATVTAAQIGIEVFNPSGNSYEIYQVLRPWDEDVATWNVADAAVPWETPGAQGASDKGSDVLGAISASVIGAYTVTLNSAGIAVIQSWIDGSAPNHGFVIGSSSSADGVDFHSSESLTIANRPAMTVVYNQVPPPVDSDGDGIQDQLDNCTVAANPDQTDSNNDGFGNRCDADINDDCVVNVADLGLLRAVFFQSNANADFNSDGVVNVLDLGIMRSVFFAVPGPSGVAGPCVP